MVGVRHAHIPAQKPVSSMLYEERLEAAEQRRIEGNELYAQSDFDGCLAKYVLGLNYFSEDFMMQVGDSFEHLS